MTDFIYEETDIEDETTLELLQKHRSALPRAKHESKVRQPRIRRALEPKKKTKRRIDKTQLV